MVRNVILVTGASGWLASQVIHGLLDSSVDISIIAADIILPQFPSSRVLSIKADLTDNDQVRTLFQTPYGVPEAVYCMHGIMSRGSEDNFDLGIKVNIDSVRRVLEAAAKQRGATEDPIKFIFTSGLAVFGGPLPPVITTATLAIPQSAYGTSKLIMELFINEFTRRGLVDGRILRLPTIIVRPGSPAAATSAFLSSIIREPLKGQLAYCPIGSSIHSSETDLKTWVASSGTTIQNLLHARNIPACSFSPHTRVVCLPGFTTTIREMLEALEKVGGPQALERVVFRPNETDRRIISSWPEKADNSYATSLGFLEHVGGIVPVVQQFKDYVDAERI